MFFGGLFLYISYYGCDQTQVQRELSSKNCDDTNLSLFLNGLLRFPLVLTYCLLGVCIGAYIVKNPHFLNSLVEGSGEPNFNLAVPRFILQNLPHGVIGIMMVSLFSAAMSSLDSTINSLSATTTRDLYERFLCPQGMDGPTQLKVSRIFTVFWGVVCVAFSFFVGGISPSIIESVNKVGSLGNGPILALFVLGILTRFVHGTGAVCGLLGGFAFNAYLWINEPQVSWLWWNVTGFVVAVGISLLVSALIPSQRRKPESLDGLVFESGTEDEFHYERNWPRYHAVLLGYTVLMITACWLWTSSFN
jgi:SSS family solute:Na+ symporter